MYYPLDPRVYREATALIRAGYDVDVVCLRQEDELPQVEHEGVRVYRIMKGPLNKDSITRYLFHTLLFTLLALARISLLSLSRHYELYQVHTMPDFLVFSCIIGRLWGKPIILDLHDLSVELYQTKLEGRYQSLMPLVAWQERQSCRFADHLITTSEGFKQQLIMRGNPAHKVTLILNSADPVIYRYDPSRSFRVAGDDLRLLYHGTVAPRFGIHIAIAAL